MGKGEECTFLSPKLSSHILPNSHLTSSLFLAKLLSRTFIIFSPKADQPLAEIFEI